MALRKEPVELLTCDNGQDALRLALEHRPAVILADLDMPGLTGIELCRAVREEGTLRNTKVVLICGSFDQVDEARLQSVQADGRLWKPFEAHVLIALLSALLKSPIRETADATDGTITDEMTRATFQAASRERTAKPTTKPSPNSSAPPSRPPPPPPPHAPSVQQTRIADEPTAAPVPSAGDWAWSAPPAPPPRSEASLTESADSTAPPGAFWTTDFGDSPGLSDNLSIASVTPPSAPPLDLEEPDLEGREPTAENPVVYRRSDFERDAAAVPERREQEWLSDPDLSAFRGSAEATAPPTEQRTRHAAPPPAPSAPFDVETSFPELQVNASSSLREHDVPAGSQVSEEQVRALIREELDAALRSWFRERLEAKLHEVLAEIDRD